MFNKVSMWFPQIYAYILVLIFYVRRFCPWHWTNGLTRILTLQLRLAETPLSTQSMRLIFLKELQNLNQTQVSTSGPSSSGGLYITSETSCESYNVINSDALPCLMPQVKVWVARIFETKSAHGHFKKLFQILRLWKEDG